MQTVSKQWRDSVRQSWCETHTHKLARLAFLMVCAMPFLLALGRAVADIGVCTVAVSFLWYSAIKRDWSWMLKFESRLLGLLYFYLVLQSIIVAPGASAVGYALEFARVLLFYLAIRFWLFPNRSCVIAALGIMLPTVALVLFDTYFQYFTGHSLRGHAISLDTARLTGPLSHYNIGNYMFKIAIPIAAMALLLGRNIRTRAYYITIATFLLLAIAIIPLSGERSITAMLLVALASMLLLAFVKLKQYRRYVAGAMLGLVALGFVLSSQDVVIQRSAQLVDNITNFDSSVYGQLFKASSILITQNPLLGIGTQQFATASHALFNAGMTTYWDVHPHNFYIQWWVETGIFGLVIVLTFLGLLLQNAFRIYQTIHGLQMVSLSIVLGNLVGFLFPLGITQSNFSNWSECIYWFSLALMMTVIEQHEVPDDK